MKVKFEDGLAEVSVPGVLEPVKRGHAVEVSEETGKQLLKQGWQEAGSHKKAEVHTPAIPDSVEKENK